MESTKMKPFLTLLLLCLLPQLAWSETLPAGWQQPSEADYNPDDYEWFKRKPPNKVVADFNGDGVQDTAWILSDDLKTKSGLFVSLSGEDRQFQTLLLDESATEYSVLNMGISPLQPGEHQTACGKGYWECADDEPAVLKLDAPALDYFAFESAHSVFYWDKETSAFKRIWLSD